MHKENYTMIEIGQSLARIVLLCPEMHYLKYRLWTRWCNKIICKTNGLL